MDDTVNVRDFANRHGIINPAAAISQLSIFPRGFVICYNRPVFYWSKFIKWVVNMSQIWKLRGERYIFQNLSNKPSRYTIFVRIISVPPDERWMYYVWNESSHFSPKAIFRNFDVQQLWYQFTQHCGVEVNQLDTKCIKHIVTCPSREINTMVW